LLISTEPCIQGAAKKRSLTKTAISQKRLSISVRNFPRFSVRAVCTKRENYIKFCWSV